MFDISQWGQSGKADFLEYTEKFMKLLRLTLKNNNHIYINMSQWAESIPKSPHQVRKRKVSCQGLPFGRKVGGIFRDSMLNSCKI